MSGTLPTLPARIHLDLANANLRRCHVVEYGRTLCGMGVGEADIHDWIEPVDGICPTCGKQSCPTCDLMEEINCTRLGI